MSKKQKTISLILVIGAILSFYFYNDYADRASQKKKQRLDSLQRVANIEDSIRLEREYWQTHTRVFNSLNDTVMYYYQDSTKTKKQGVSKIGYNYENWSIIVNTDSLRVNKDTLRLSVMDMYEYNPAIKNVDVYLSNAKVKHQLIDKSFKMGNGGQYIYKPQVKGVNKLDMVIYLQNDTLNRVFKYTVF